MNLYRLDFTDGPLAGTPLVDMLGPILVRESKRADAIAREESAAQNHPVTITRITGAGNMRAIRRAHPNGRIERI